MADNSLPQTDAFHARAAVGWLELGSTPEARRELDGIALENREHPDVLEVWWKIFADEDDWPAALAAAEKLIARAPERENGWVEQSFALHELERTAEAFERLVPVTTKFRKAFVIPYNLACYQCCLGHEVEALRWLHRAVDACDARTIRLMAMSDPDLAPLRKEIARLA